VANPVLSLMMFLGLLEVLVVALDGGQWAVAVAVREQQVEIVVVTVVMAAAVKVRIMQVVAVAALALLEALLVVQIFFTQGPGVRELPTLLQALQEQVAAGGALRLVPRIKELAVQAVVAQEFITALGPLEQLTQAAVAAGVVELSVLLNKEALAAQVLCWFVILLDWALVSVQVALKLTMAHTTFTHSQAPALLR
jgi:hypothetical protein